MITFFTSRKCFTAIWNITLLQIKKKKSIYCIYRRKSIKKELRSIESFKYDLLFESYMFAPYGFLFNKMQVTKFLAKVITRLWTNRCKNFIIGWSSVCMLRRFWVSTQICKSSSGSTFHKDEWASTMFVFIFHHVPCTRSRIRTTSLCWHRCDRTFSFLPTERSVHTHHATHQTGRRHNLGSRRTTTIRQRNRLPHL